MAWEEDKLGREKFGKHVIKLLLNRFEHKKAFIANLDAPWGQGKTFFLQNLADDLSDRGYPVAVVNAWQDDRAETPLIAVLAAIDAALNGLGEPAKGAASAVANARRNLTPVVSELAKQVGKHALKVTTGIAIDKALEAMEADDEFEADHGAISSGVDAVSAEAFKVFEDRIAAQRLENKAVEAFRIRTAEALQSSDLKLPLFVIVDELDRCRPPYAVQMLEEMRHVFAIEGIVFLIGTDTVQLSHSVNALYGEKFDSSRYLRRFFDRVIVFPPVDRKEYVASFADDSSIDWEAFQGSDGVTPVEVFDAIFTGRSYSNRDIEQFFEIVDTFASSWAEDAKIEPIYLAALVDDHIHNPTDFAERADLIDFEARRGVWTAEGHNGKVDLARTSESIHANLVRDLRDTSYAWPAKEYYIDEYNRRVAGQQHRRPVFSLLTSYRERIILSARIVEE